MDVRHDATGGRWSSPFVVRLLGFVVVLAVAAAGFFVAAAALEGGSTELPMEHGLEQSSSEADVAPTRGLLIEMGVAQGSS